LSILTTVTWRTSRMLIWIGSSFAFGKALGATNTRTLARSLGAPRTRMTVRLRARWFASWRRGTSSKSGRRASTPRPRGTNPRRRVRGRGRPASRSTDTRLGAASRRMARDPARVDTRRRAALRPHDDRAGSRVVIRHRACQRRAALPDRHPIGQHLPRGPAPKRHRFARTVSPPIAGRPCRSRGGTRDRTYTRL